MACLGCYLESPQLEAIRYNHLGRLWARISSQGTKLGTERRKSLGG